MTRPARDGRDGPFNAWLRAQRDLDASRFGLYASDVDFAFHKYRIRDDNGKDYRDVKLMLDVEVKCAGRKPSPEQKETLFLRHQILRRGCQRVKIYSPLIHQNVAVWHFGQCILILKGDRPDDRRGMTWYVFDEQGMAHPIAINEDVLKAILRFDVDPNKPTARLSLRRHHKKTEVIRTVVTELQFETEEILTTIS